MMSLDPSQSNELFLIKFSQQGLIPLVDLNLRSILLACKKYVTNDKSNISIIGTLLNALEYAKSTLEDLKELNQ